MQGHSYISKFSTHYEATYVYEYVSHNSPNSNPKSMQLFFMLEEMFEI